MGEGGWWTLARHGYPHLVDNNKQTQFSVIFDDMTTSNFDNILQSKT